MGGCAPHAESTPRRPLFTCVDDHTPDAIGADVREFAGKADPADDITVLALRWLGPGSTS